MTEQQDRAWQFVQRVQRKVRLMGHKWDERNQRGYYLLTPARERFGFVRFNIAGDNKGRFVVYAYPPYEDPRGLFFNPRRGQPNDGWRTFIDPADLTTKEYAVKVLESAWDAR